MKTEPFIDKLAQTILDHYADNILDTVVVLPNKRARIFLLKALQQKSDKTIFAPQIISIEEFIQDVAQVRTIDPIEILFEFYDVYVEISKSNAQSFELFANWSKILLQDFNEIDRYLLDPDKILTYIKDIEDIKRWDVTVENSTTLLNNYVDFWKQLPQYYHTFYKHLLAKGVGYQGLIYREAVKKINTFCDIDNNNYYQFAGFNAFNKAEEEIVQKLLAVQKATIFWDADETFLNDYYHDAGLFLRRFKSKWKHFKTNTFDWIFDDFSQEKNIQIIGTPQTIGQAKITGKIIENLQKDFPNDKNLENVAVVLGEEALLIPLLYSLPSNVGALNITMGYPSKNNPSQVLLSKLFKMHVNAAKRNQKDLLFYYKDVLDVLTHPLIEAHANARALVDIINKNNYTFITQHKLFQLHPNRNQLFEILFQKWSDNPCETLQIISQLLLFVKTTLNDNSDENKIAKAFVYAVFKTLNKLINYFSNHPKILGLDTLYAIYKQVIDLAEVSFEGEPLKGLQIMGVLESRVLDFNTVIITSMNEGKFPAGKASNSFIPYDVKREHGLPTYKEKDAIYTYHFYHLLQRAKNIYLIYNTESEGLDGGEKSRFLMQLEVEKQKNHHITHQIYNADLPEIASEPMTISKSESVLLRLKDIATEGLSPSAITLYIRNPIDFYFQKILSIKQLEEVEESVALNTLGTIIHKTLEILYKPFINRELNESDIQNCFERLDIEVLIQFKEIYKEGEIKKGKNLLAFEVAKRNIYNFLNAELQAIRNGDLIKILYLEHSFERILTHPALPFPVKIRGNIDRVELRKDVIRIIDYKTGKVEAKNVTLNDWHNLTTDIKNDKIIQLLCYVFMIEESFTNTAIEAGIVSFKNLKNGFLPFGYKPEKTVLTTIDASIMLNFTEQLVLLLVEIFNKDIAFEVKAKK